MAIYSSLHAGATVLVFSNLLRATLVIGHNSSAVGGCVSHGMHESLIGAIYASLPAVSTTSRTLQAYNAIEVDLALLAFRTVLFEQGNVPQTCRSCYQNKADATA